MSYNEGQIRVCVERNGRVVAETARVAATLIQRLKGLLGTGSLQVGSGLILERCTSVHMLFMRYPIDVIFCDPKGRVLRICARLKPWRFSPIVLGAHYAIELPSGTAQRCDVQKGDTLIFSQVLLKPPAASEREQA